MTLARAGLEALNILGHAAHLFVIFFSVFGWMWCETRIANLILLLAVLLSWYALGPLLGKKGEYGYCLITDLQWQLRRHMGLEAPPWGYMKFLADRLSGRAGDQGLDPDLIERITAAAFFASLAASVAMTVLLDGC
jgi:hypothetical protein